MVYVYTQIPQVLCFVCLSDCYDKVDNIALKDKIDLKDNYWDDKYIFV